MGGCDSVYLPMRPAVGRHAGDLLDPMVCTARPQIGADGKPRRHRGKHRTTLPGGVRLRWTDGEQHPSTPAPRKTP